MKVTKPMKLGLVSRVFEQGRRPQLHLGAVLGFQLDAPRTVIDEISFWPAAMAELGGMVLDEGLGKPSGELLVAGRCFAARGEATTATYVRVEAGTLEKRLAVIGDREWRHGTQTPPQPFLEMPVDWQHAFGGADYPANPYGIGIASGEDSAVPLPNVELYGELVRSPRDRPRPGAFGAMDPSFGVRRSLAGTFGSDYVAKWAPGLPPDHDPSFFNLATSDQRIPTFWSGTETFVVENMHPRKARLSGALPGLLARAFVAQRAVGGPRFHEVGLVCDTLWLLPTAGVGALIFRGRLAVADDDAHDVEHVVLACEEIGRPRPIEHYEAARRRRLDKDEGAIADITDSDLMPAKDSGVVANVSFGEMGMWTKPLGLSRKKQARGAKRDREEARRKLVEVGRDTAFLDDEPAAPEPPDPEDLDAVAEFLSAQSKESAKQVVDREDLKARIAADLKKAADESGRDVSELIQAEPEAGPGPYGFTAESVLKPMREAAADARASGSPLVHIEAKLEDPEFLSQLAQWERESLDLYRSSTHLGRPAAPMTEEAAGIARMIVGHARESDVSLSFRDFTGANFSGLDLGGLDLRGTFLENSDLRDADLTGTDLSGAVLAHADLRGARLRGANLAGANLGGSNLQGADLSGADLTRTILMRAHLARARFDGADLTDAELLEAHLAGVDFSGARFSTATFMKADLTRTSFARASLVRCTFIECVLEGCDFEEANVEKATLVASGGHGIRFVRARLNEAVVSHKNDLTAADFTDASLERACLRTTVLTGARFTGALMTMCDLSECDARSANFDRAVMSAALLVRTNLDQASLRSVNLSEAHLSKSRLAGSDFSGAQLTRALFLQARGDATTRFTDATTTFAQFDSEERQADRP